MKSKIAMMVGERCIVCKGSSWTPIYQNTLLRCKKCQFTTANIRKGTSDLRKIYTSSYFKGEEYLDYIAEKNALQHNFRRRLSYLLRNNLVSKGGNILEIGCAYGFLGETAREMLAAQYTGFDVVREACVHAKLLNPESIIICGDYLKYQSPNTYDSVFMFDVIEHLKHPQRFIRKIYDELKGNGRLIITTGDIDTLLPKLQKHRWRMIHPPTHLHYFSRKTLTLLLEKNGFGVRDIRYFPTCRSVKQIFFSLFMLHKKITPFTHLLYKCIPESLFISINTFDIVFLVAQKNPDPKVLNTETDN
jgi:2-polyprenyl-3-methyl-5-hydroxy-6-metoxy-1,4-benzoquinol methylase